MMLSSRVPFKPPVASSDEITMSLFDYYRPASSQRCPVCGRPLTNWQGKDGPNGLLVWAEKSASPIDQLVTDDEARLDQRDREQLRLPARFMIYSHDCPEHQPIRADGAAPEGVWMETIIRPYAVRGSRP